MNDYVFGAIKKEALDTGQWQYGVNAQFFFTGPAAANFDINATAGKNFKSFGSIVAGIQQTLSNAPYAYTSFHTNFWTSDYDFDKTSITKVWAELQLDRLHLNAGIRNYVLGNYIYYDASLQPQQQSGPFSVLQVYGRKLFTYGIFNLDNEIVWQQPTANTKVHVPALMLRHSFSIETALFKNALKIATGIEARYNTSYYNDGYIPFYNQFYYQDSIKINNPVQLSAFFNFKVKSFRFFFMGDQLQQLFIKKNVINFINYPAQDALIRFGFNWIMVN
jgi:hypothetical protein